MAETVTYTFGGTVQAGGGIYIPRRADGELLRLCQDAVFAYVLTPRQMGKSSLMVRTAQTLAQDGVQAVIVDLQELGAQVTAEQWYFGFLVKLDDQLMDTQVSFEDTAKDLIYGDADNNQSVSSEEIAKTYSFDKQRVVNNVKWLLCELNVATASNANNEQNRKALMAASLALAQPTYAGRSPFRSRKMISTAISMPEKSGRS